MPKSEYMMPPSHIDRKIQAAKKEANRQIIDIRNPPTFELRRASTFMESAVRRRAEWLAGDVCIYDFMNSFKEINKLFDLLGVVFSFAKSDINEKLTNINNILHNNKKMASGSIHTILNLETQNGQISAGNNSVARNLLVLNRSLAFIIAIVYDLRYASANDSSAAIVTDAYNRTIAKYHSWLVRKTVTSACLMLPTRAEIIKRVNYKRHSNSPNSDIEIVYHYTWRVVEPGI